jgi:surface carbohydrate biosynthesis protein|tara:strand:- start:1710 stop:3221 length:1512 start_codon:yes stop_codon:yes gene_type:complete
MKVYIIYERFNAEFYGKYILGIELIRNDPNISEVKIGYYKDLIFELINLEPSHNENIVVFYKDIWRTSQVLIDIFKEKGFKFICHHEEEFTIFSLNNINNYLGQIIDRKYFKKIDYFFTLSNKSKDILTKHGLSGNIHVTGNTKFDYQNLVKKKGMFKKIDDSFILLTLGDCYFKYKEDYFFNKEKIKNYNFDNFLKDQNKDASFDNALFSRCIKDQIKFFLKVIKRYKNLSFILRPHPNDRSSEKNYKKIFKNCKNVKVSFDNDINFWIKNSSAVISGPCFTSIESNILGIKNLIYYDEKNKFHKTLYNKHFCLKFTPENIINNLKDLGNLLESKNYENNFLTLADEYYSLKVESYQKIINKIQSLNYKDSANTKKNFLFKFFLNKVSKEINYDIKNKRFNLNAYLTFKNKFKFSLSRIYFAIKFFQNSNRFDFLNILYKYIRGRNFNNHSLDLLSGKLDEINGKDLELFTNYYYKNKINFQKQIYISNDNRKLSISTSNKK